MSRRKPSVQISHLFRALSQPARVEILLAIGSGEACVCHLETVLKMRQAYISQHLMALREAGILTARRDGRFIYYRLVDPAWMDFIHMAGVTSGVLPESLSPMAPGEPVEKCVCPKCTQDSVSAVEM